MIIGLGTAAGGLALGTSAFTSVEADRDVAVEVADDSDAFLALEPAEDSPNAQYAQETNGTLELNFTGDNDGIDGGGEGFNARADTGISRVFEIRNQGTQEVEVTLRSSEEDDTDTNGVVLVPEDVEGPGGRNVMLIITAHDPDEGLDPVELGPGEKQQFSVSASVRDDISTAPEINTDEIIVEAEATE